MLIVQIDVIRPEPFQRRVARLMHVFGLATDRPDIRIFLRALIGELGRQKYLIASALQRFADQFLVIADAVGVGGVPEVVAQFERAQQCGSGFGVVAIAVEFAPSPMQPSPIRETTAP